MSQMEKDLTFLRGENADLLGQIVALQRQIDILSSARLVTRKADNTPVATDNDSLKSIVAERDDLRHLSAGLKLELEKLRDELTVTIRERDAARQACELMQAEKVTHSRELQDLRQQAGQRTAGSPTEETPFASSSNGRMIPRSIGGKGRQHTGTSHRRPAAHPAPQQCDKSIRDSPGGHRPLPAG